MTRYTLLRVLVACISYQDTHVMRYWIPRKMKRYHMPMWAQLQMRDSLKRLYINVDFAQHFREDFIGLGRVRIGDNLSVRRPVRLT